MKRKLGKQRQTHNRYRQHTIARLIEAGRGMGIDGGTLYAPDWDALDRVVLETYRASSGMQQSADLLGMSRSTVKYHLARLSAETKPNGCVAGTKRGPYKAKRRREMCECCGVRPKRAGFRKLCDYCWRNGEDPSDDWHNAGVRNEAHVAGVWL